MKETNGKKGAVPAPFELVSALAALLLAVGCATVFRACAATEDGAWMHCHAAQLAVTACAAAQCALLLGAAFIGSRPVRACLCALSCACAVVAFFIPGGIVSMCAMQSMRCWAVMRPFSRIMAAVVALMSAAGVVRAARGR